MPRVKKGKTTTRRRRKILKHTKGFKWRRKTHLRAAREALLHAWSRAFHDRRKKKGQFRRLWNIKINAGARAHDISYSRLIHGLKQAGVTLDRKVLAHIAEHTPEVFAQIVATAKKHIPEEEMQPAEKNKTEKTPA